MTNEILDISQIDSANIKIYNDKYNVKLIIKELIQIYKAKSENKIEGVYQFKTEDGASYKIVFEGEGKENDLRHKVVFNWLFIKSIIETK